jgi:ubiquinone/menaquinone biosynthesis C-methylase UbiE
MTAAEMLSVEQQVAAFAERYSRLAEVYDRLWSPAIRPFAERLIAGLPLADARNVLDVGTGAGALLPALRAAAPRATVVGVDNSEGMLQLARARHDGPLHVMDAQNLRLPGAHFDAALVAFLLFHLPYPDRCLAEVFRVLKSGGTVATATWGDERFPAVDSIWDEELNRAGAETFPLPAVDNRGACNTEAKVSALMRNAGYGSIEVWTEPLVHRWEPEHRFEYHVRVTSRLRLASLGDSERDQCLAAVHQRLQSATAEDYVYEGAVILATAVKP